LRGEFCDLKTLTNDVADIVSSSVNIQYKNNLEIK